MQTIDFENLFGIPAQEIKEVCVFAPFLTKDLTKDLNIPELKRGKPFSSGQSEHFTFIYSHIGAPQVGDATLYLEATACEHLILLGACGLVQKTPTLKVGSLITPTQSLALESFSKLLVHDYHNFDSLPADTSLLNQFMGSTRDSVKEVNCATFGSIKLEEEYFGFLRENNIDVVDLECSAFFAAAQHIGRSAIALLYATDIIGETSLFAPQSGEDEQMIKDAQNKANQIICDFTAKLAS